MEACLKRNIELLIENKNIFSLNELGRLTGVSVSIISRILSGITKKPSDETIMQIANYFQIPPADLMFKDLSYNENIEKKEDIEYKHDSLKERLMYLMRKRNIISSYELSKTSGVEYESIQAILFKNRQTSHIETLTRLARSFGITVKQLKCEEDLPENLFKITSPQVPIIYFDSVKDWLNSGDKKFIDSYQDVEAKEFNESMFFMKPKENFDKTILFYLFEKLDHLIMEGNYLISINDTIDIMILFPFNNDYYYIISENKKIPYKKSEINIYAKLMLTRYK